MTFEEIKKAKMTNEELGEEEIARIKEIIVNFKRAMEIVYLIPGAFEEMKADGKAFKEKYNLPNVDTEGVMQIFDKDNGKALIKLSKEEQIEKITYQAFRYQQYNGNKILSRNRFLEVYNVPANTRMKKWRERQIERSKGYCGGAFSANVQVCVAYELTDGCSVGCPFCGVGAKKLRSVFTYDKDNIELFRNVLRVMHETIGDAAGRGTMYLESEPLDNRDYEKFLVDYIKEFNILPQITTAVPLRDVERMHKLLDQLKDNKSETHYRFSIKSVQEAKEVLNTFSPEELLRVELLPQYEQAPGFSGFAKSGRELEREAERESSDDKKVVSTICCVSGFVINFARKEVRFITPHPANSKYPDGEIVIDRMQFDDAEDLRQKVLAMIDEHIVNVLPSDKILKPYSYFKIVEGENGEERIISEAGYYKDIKGSYKGFGGVVRLLFEEKYTKKEIAEILYKTKKIDVTETYFCLTALYKNGIINEYEW